MQPLLRGACRQSAHHLAGQPPVALNPRVGIDCTGEQSTPEPGMVALTSRIGVRLDEPVEFGPGARRPIREHQRPGGLTRLRNPIQQRSPVHDPILIGPPQLPRNRLI